MKIKLIHGDCLDMLAGIDDCSVESIVTDPPYGISFMNKNWDTNIPGVDVWRECLRVLKPGGYLLVFAGTRTQHRMAVNIEDAGFEIRDMIAWVYSQGYPKSLDVSKAIDKAAGAEREVIGSKIGLPGYSLKANKGSNVYGGGFGANGSAENECAITAPATEAARQWQGWGTAIKPAFEPITVARKPLIGAVYENVLMYGTGGINVDGCRVGTESTTRKTGGKASQRTVYGKFPHDSGKCMTGGSASGRYPANLIHDGSEGVLKLFPMTKSGDLTGQPRVENKIYGSAASTLGTPRYYQGDAGTAARFFYCAKASKSDRDDGLAAGGNIHPTVKPTKLMCYLVRLVTPPGGTVLDPFMGSGSTGKACNIEGFNFIGIEREKDYVDIARARIAATGISMLCEDEHSNDIKDDVKNNTQLTLF